MSRTRITTYTNEEYVVQRSIEEVLEVITDDFGKIQPSFNNVSDRVSISTLQIVEVREMS